MQNLMTVYLTWQVYRGSLSIGDYAALLNGTFTMMFQLQGLVGIIPAFYEHSLYIGNLRKILDAPCKIEKDTGLTIPSDRPLTIEFDHVSFCYPFSEKLVLDDVCLCFTAGTKTAIVGHNGAGKTTTMPVSDFLLSRSYKQAEDEAQVASVLEHVGLTANMRRCITHSRPEDSNQIPDFLCSIIYLLHKSYLQKLQILYTVITGSYRDSDKKKKSPGRKGKI